jgi:hypothetical protein
MQMIGFLNRLLARLRNQRFDEDLREELRLHEELKREELERAGSSLHLAPHRITRTGSS